MFAAMDRSIWLWVLPFLIVVWLFGYFIKVHRLKGFVDPQLWSKMIPNLSQSRRFLKVLWVVFGLLFVILAYMQPQFGKIEEDVVHTGSYLVIAVDASKSMLAEDLSPNRLQYAQREIRSLIDQSVGDKIGLVVFSGNAFVHCPFTTDYEALKLFVDDIHVGMIPRQGTNLAAAIRKSRDMIGPERYENGAIVVFSDGESFEGNSVRSAEVAGEFGIPIFVVGLGSNEGQPIPLKDEYGRRFGYKRDREGQVVLSRVQQSVLQSVADVSDGHVYFVSDGRVISSDLYQKISSVETRRFEEKQLTKNVERYQWVLILGFLFLLLDLSFSEAKKSMVCLLLFLWFPFPLCADLGLRDYKDFQEGTAFLKSGKFAEAIAHYVPLVSREVDDDALDYNLAMAFYHQGDYDASEKLFLDILQSRSDLSKDIRFQLANIQFKKGRFQSAVKQYRDLLVKDPTWDAVKHNLDLVLSKLSHQSPQSDQDDAQSPTQNVSDHRENGGEGSLEGDDSQRQTLSDAASSETVVRSSDNLDEDVSDGSMDMLEDESVKRASEQVVQQFLSTLDQQEAKARQRFLRRFKEGGGRVSHDW